MVPTREGCHTQVRITGDISTADIEPRANAGKLGHIRRKWGPKKIPLFRKLVSRIFFTSSLCKDSTLRNNLSLVIPGPKREKVIMKGVYANAGVPENL